MSTDQLGWIIRYHINNSYVLSGQTEALVIWNDVLKMLWRCQMTEKILDDSAVTRKVIIMDV